LVEGYGDLLDINMGCPVRKVVGTGAGSALLREPGKIAAIIRAVRSATNLPLTLKIRSGWHCGDETYREIGMIAESEGCDAITLHPRSRSQMFSGSASWEQLRELKASVSIPVLGSGDLFRAEDCLRMLRETGCDGVMIARGALGAPWIFRQVAELAKHGVVTPVTNLQRVEAMRQHLELFCREVGEAVAVREMKKHIGWYARGFAGAADIRRACNTARDIHGLHTLFERISVIPDEH
jgi:nifR3 family TIM-barrel protein